MKIWIVWMSLLLVYSLPGFSQNIVSHQGMTTSMHREHVGRIIFTREAIDPAALSDKDALRNYVLTNKSNLFINVFMGNSLTNYLHALEPQLPADSLVKIGNYQFSLFVDGTLVYKSNLMPGAPYAKTQDTATTIFRPLIDHSRTGGLWSLSFWERFIINGGDIALTDGKHLLRMEIKPYLDMAGETKVGDIIAAGDLSLDVRRKPVLDLSTIRLNAIRPYDGLPVSREKFDVNRVKELKGRIDDGVFRHINAIVVLKNGKLLIEEYFNAATRTTLHDPRSVGKTFASTMVGIALKENYLKSEHQVLKDFYDLHHYEHYSTQKDSISIKDLLTMSSVFDGDDNDWNSPGNEEKMYPTDNWVRFTLNLPTVTSRPKGEWHYFTAGAMLLGDILDKSVPGGLEKYAHEKLFGSLHINQYKWQHTPQRVANTAGGIQLRALDFAKYGQLYKNGGTWQGRRVLPKEWVARSFTRHQKIPGREEEYYGYLFWNKTFTVKGKPYETYYCAGNGGNKIFVFKDLPVVVVITASAYNQSYAHPQSDKIVQEFILPAVLNVK